MTLGQGPQALAEYLGENWEAVRQGRPDLPDVVRDDADDYSPDPTDHTTQPGKVLIVPDRFDAVEVNHAVTDGIWCYHPEADPPAFTDSGHVEQNIVETVQIDISATDGFNAPEGVASSARNRMVGERGTSGFLNGGPYPGLAGEVKYLLELTRRGLDEWDVARTDAVNAVLNNSNADFSWRVDLEHVSVNTADV